MPPEHLRRRLRVSGRVQGVFFRVSTRKVALKFGVTGWVKNDFDGSVVAEIQGPQDAVNHVIAFCREGPQYASVTSCVITEMTALEHDRDFVIR